MIYKIGEPGRAAGIFEGWQETAVWSCLDGTMGEIYTDHGKEPSCAMALLGDFAFYAGEVNRELVEFLIENQQKSKKLKYNFIIMVPRNEEWAAEIETVYRERAKRVTRYALKKEPDVFEVNKLRQAADSLEAPYEMQLMDERLFTYAKEHSWAEDWVSQFETWEQYERLGLGIVVLKDKEPVAGASSYTRYREGIEIQIDTRKEYRRQGLAYACGARLILECKERGLYPSWDAQNLWSVGLAEKLGYHFDREYTAYEVKLGEMQ